MDRRPVRNAREFIGYEAGKNWEAFHTEPFATLEKAQRACQTRADVILHWQHHATSPEGHKHYMARIPDVGISWHAGPMFRRYREPIPDAEFVSPDPRCTIYVVPQGSRWAIFSQIDLENVHWEDMVAAGLASSNIEGMMAAQLYDIPCGRGATKEEAVKFGRYEFGRALVQSGTPRPLQSWLRAKLREFGRRFV